MNNKNFEMTEGIILAVILFFMGAIFFVLFLQGQKKAELIDQQYHLKCEWYNVRSCEEMLPYKVGKQQTFNVNGLK